MKHKHYEMIVAKAANMDLVIFIKEGESWVETSESPFFFCPDLAFFMCIPKHKEAVLNVLNGGESQANYGDRWTNANCGIPVKWGDDWWYMSDECESRIKTRKQKRWIAAKGQSVSPCSYTSRQEAIDLNPDYSQFIEIEIEV